MLGRLVLAGAMAAAATVANAQSCQSYVGSVVEPKTFDAVAATLRRLPTVKDEFETTAAFDARVEAARAQLPARLVMGVPFDPQYAVYNADSGAFQIKSYAIDNTNTNYYGSFGYGTPYDGKVKINTLSNGNLDIVISSKDVVKGSYVGTNSYGASARIIKIARTTKAVFDRAPQNYEEDLFGPLDDAVVFTVPIPPEQARTMKDSFRAAIVIAPKAPFFVAGHGLPGDVTISNPTDVTEAMQIVMADIQCALLTDSASKVLAAKQTN